MKVINRIKKSEDFAVTINKGHLHRLPSYKIFAIKNEFGYTRVGLSVSSRLGCAVTRNRIKRQVRAICDEIIDYNKESLDIVIIVRSAFLDKTFNDNKTQLFNLLNN